MRLSAVVGAIVALLAVVPAPASAGLSVSGTPTTCVFQQHWETPSGGGAPYINVDIGTCWVDLSWSITPDTCPSGPNGEEGRGGVGDVHQRRFTGQVERFFAQSWSQPAGGTWTARGRIGVSPGTTLLFTEVDGEKLVGNDEWKIGPITCHYGSGPVESAWQKVQIIIRGPNYKPPGGGGGGTQTDPPACPEAARLNLQSRAWNTHAQLMTGRANEANAEVIRLAEEARDAFVEALGLDGLLNPASKASENYLDETIAELRKLTEIAGKKRVGTADMDRTEVLTLFRLRKYFEKFKAGTDVLDKLTKRLALTKGLYLLGLAAQKGVERDTYRRHARQSLARSDRLRGLADAAFRACQGGAAAAIAAVVAKPKPRYARLAAPQRPLGLRLAKGSGVPRKARIALNRLMTGEQEANAMQAAIALTLDRAELARKAGKGVWQDRQLAHARLLAQRLAKRLDAQSQLRARPLPASLNGSATFAVRNPHGLTSALQDLRLPAPVRRLLARLHLKAGPFERGWRKPPAGDEVVSRSFAMLLGDPALIARDAARAAEWRAFATL